MYITKEWLDKASDELLKISKELSKENEKLTREQFVEVLKQALASGDFMKHVYPQEGSQCITYIPYRRLSEVEARYNELIYAVERVHPEETRHETALRYIQEAEQRANGSGEDKGI
jgi:hypothetical protein